MNLLSLKLFLGSTLLFGLTAGSPQAMDVIGSPAQVCANCELERGQKKFALDLKTCNACIAACGNQTIVNRGNNRTTLTYWQNLCQPLLQPQNPPQQRPPLQQLNVEPEQVQENEQQAQQIQIPQRLGQMRMQLNEKQRQQRKILEEYQHRQPEPEPFELEKPAPQNVPPTRHQLPPQQHQLMLEEEGKKPLNAVPGGLRPPVMPIRQNLRFDLLRNARQLAIDLKDLGDAIQVKPGLKKPQEPEIPDNKLKNLFEAAKNSANALNKLLTNIGKEHNLEVVDLDQPPLKKVEEENIQIPRLKQREKQKKDHKERLLGAAQDLGDALGDMSKKDEPAEPRHLEEAQGPFEMHPPQVVKRPQEIKRLNEEPRSKTLQEIKRLKEQKQMKLEEAMPPQEVPELQNN